MYKSGYSLPLPVSTAFHTLDCACLKESKAEGYLHLPFVLFTFVLEVFGAGADWRDSWLHCSPNSGSTEQDVLWAGVCFEQISSVNNKGQADAKLCYMFGLLVPFEKPTQRARQPIALARGAQQVPCSLSPKLGLSMAQSLHAVTFG